MGTLTYPEGLHWRDCKRHWRALMARLARRCQRQHLTGWSVCWFVEFQRNGRPHFHFFTDLWVPRDWLAQAWFEIVGSRDPKHLAAGTRIETLRAGRSGTISYARKYAAKLDQKTLPALLENSGIGRWWGVVGARGVVAATTRVDEACQSDENVARAQQNLREVVAKAKREGRARVFRYEYCHVACFRDRLTEAQVREAFDQLAREVTRCRSCAETDRIAPSRGAPTPRPQPG